MGALEVSFYLTDEIFIVVETGCSDRAVNRLAEIAVVQRGHIGCYQLSVSLRKRVWRMEKRLGKFIQRFGGLRAKCQWPSDSLQTFR
jgi:hypothetical protein